MPCRRLVPGRPSTSLPCAPYKYKRIKDYLYDMEAVLGKGNFSTVYRAVKEGTGKYTDTQMNLMPSKLCNSHR